MKIQETLDAASDIVLKKRDQQYGANSRISMHTKIATVWSGILGTEVTALQVALCMAGMKLVRAENAPQVTDSFIDAIGYTAIANELAAEQAFSDPPRLPAERVMNAIVETDKENNHVTD